MRFILLLFVALQTHTAFACSVLEGTKSTLPSDLVKGAEYIIVAKTIGLSKDQNGAPATDRFLKSVDFKVLEIVKGEKSSLHVPGGTFAIRGLITDLNKFKRFKVEIPHRYASPPYGQHTRAVGASCRALDYVEGRSYLLFLKDGKHYCPLFSACNEEVKGIEDPWIQWVKGEAGSVSRAGDIRTISPDKKGSSRKNFCVGEGCLTK